jgi:dTDP-4-amino-4,6-dideoxygalactose transaminase
MGGREPIPLTDLAAEHRELRDDLQKAFLDVLDSGSFILGPRVSAFEEQMAGYLGVRHAVGVNSGTDALVLALRAAGVGPGDEVVTTPFSFFATAEAISNVGATPVFVDIDPVSFNIDLGQVEGALTPATRALLPVHLFGNPVDMGTLAGLAERHGILVVEDTAQALGARWDGRLVGTIGTAGALSFFPSKNLGALGDAGLVSTDDDAIADQVRMLRAHGGRSRSSEAGAVGRQSDRQNQSQDGPG